MVNLTGLWSSKVHSKVAGQIKISLNEHKWLPEMTGRVKFESVSDFSVEVKYEHKFYEGITIDRLFIRQRKFDLDTYYTLQLSSYNGGPWNGIYTTLYPCDYGEINSVTIDTLSESSSSSSSSSSAAASSSSSSSSSAAASSSSSSSAKSDRDRDRDRRSLKRKL